MIKETTIRHNEVYYLVNNRTFFEFCNVISGFDVINARTGSTVPRWLLYWNGINPEALMAGSAKFKLKLRPKPESEN